MGLEVRPSNLWLVWIGWSMDQGFQILPMGQSLVDLAFLGIHILTYVYQSLTCMYIYICVRLKSVNLFPLTESPPKLRLQKKSRMYSPKKAAGVNVMFEWGSHFFPRKKKEQKHPLKVWSTQKCSENWWMLKCTSEFLQEFSQSLIPPVVFFVVVKSSTLWGNST